MCVCVCLGGENSIKRWTGLKMLAASGNHIEPWYLLFSSCWYIIPCTYISPITIIDVWEILICAFIRSEYGVDGFCWTWWNLNRNVAETQRRNCCSLDLLTWPLMFPRYLYTTLFLLLFPNYQSFDIYETIIIDIW